ncbi:MAG: hypothetical protein WAL29_08945 [Bacteroidales bacterium]
MTGISNFKSRRGKVSCKPAELFRFVTDLRNFRQFIHGNTVEDLQLDKESCSFLVSPLGNVNVKISEREPDKKVIYTGSALRSNDFSLLLNIGEDDSGKAEVMITLDAEMNPVLKMMAAKPVNRFLETLIDEMEKFGDWNKVRE